MNILKRIRAFFTFKGEPIEMELSKAEIKNGKVFLHPSDEPTRTYCIKTNTVDILINANDQVADPDVLIKDIRNSKNPNVTEKAAKDGGKSSSKSGKDSAITSMVQVNNELDKYKKKRVSFMLYPEEYNMLMENIQSSGYKKTEYFLACVTSAKKQSMDAAYKKYLHTHSLMRKEERRSRLNANNSAVS